MGRLDRREKLEIENKQKDQVIRDKRMVLLEKKSKGNLLEPDEIAVLEEDFEECSSIKTSVNSS